MAKCNQLTRLPFKGLTVNTIFHPFGGFHQTHNSSALGDNDELIRFGVKMSKVKGQGHEQTKY